jgi:hypothetical protein
MTPVSRLRILVRHTLRRSGREMRGGAPCRPPATHPREPSAPANRTSGGDHAPCRDRPAELCVHRGTAGSREWAESLWVPRGSHRRFARMPEATRQDDHKPFGHTPSTPYTPRHPEESLLHQTVRENLETFLARAGDGDHPVPYFVERELRAYLKCGILAHGFLRLHCDGCGLDRLVPFSCKGRFCPSCCGRRMAAGREATGALGSEASPGHSRTPRRSRSTRGADPTVGLDAPISTPISLRVRHEADE